jgi:hypothetical protein
VSKINPPLNGLVLNPRHWGDRPANNITGHGTVKAFTAKDPQQTYLYRKYVAVYMSTACVQGRYSHIENWRSIRKQKVACVKNKSKEDTLIRQEFTPRYTLLHLLNALLLWYNFTSLNYCVSRECLTTHWVHALTTEIHHKFWVHFWGSEVDII